MNVLNKYSALAGAILIIIAAGSYLYLSDYRFLLESNPDKVAILIDYEEKNRLEFITRGYNWDSKREVLRWRYDEEYITLYTNQYIAARSDWRVFTKAGTLQRRSYVAGTPMYYVDDGNQFSVVKVSNYQRGHTLTETHVFTEDLNIANFPEKNYVVFNPGTEKEYELVWRIRNIEILPDQKQGRVEGCSIEFGRNVKVRWCNSADKIDFVYLSKVYDALYVHFKPMNGMQELDVSLRDPESEPIPEETTTTYTNTTKTVCNESGQCTLSLYSGIMQVFEDEQWKPIAEARSLLGYYDIIYLEKEDAFNMEVIDFNLTDIELETTFIGHPLDYPEFCTYKSEQEFKCQFKNNVKWDECEFDEELEEVCTEQIIKFDMKYEMKDGIIVANDTKFQYKGNTLDKKYSFGGNSTTIILQDADTENLDDSLVYKLNGNTNYGSGTTISVYNKDAYTTRSYIKFDLTSIPVEGATIEDANLNLHIEFNSGTWDTYVHHVYDHTWDGYDESDITWNNQVCGTLFDDTDDCNTTAEDFEYSAGLVWFDWNVTIMTKTEYDDGHDDISIAIKSPESDTGYETNRFYSKEYTTDATLIPMLVITYSGGTPKPPEDSCSCPASGHWQILNSDICTLADECSLVGGDLHLVHGSLTITSTGTLVIPSGNKIVIDKQTDVNFTIEDGGTLIIHD